MSSQHGLLASGGGTADRCIRFWNTLAAQPLQSVDTGSQVCGELVTHAEVVLDLVHVMDNLIKKYCHSHFNFLQVCNLAWSKHSNELVSTCKSKPAKLSHAR